MGRQQSAAFHPNAEKLGTLFILSSDTSQNFELLIFSILPIMHILLVESEDIQRNQLRKYLLRAHYFVDQAQTYAAAAS